MQDLVEACRDRLRYADATARKDRALYALVHEEGRTAAQATAEVEQALRDAGFTDEQVKASGVSLASVRAAMRLGRRG